MIKTRQKKATKAGKREVFGKIVMVKAKPAKTVVGFPREGTQGRVLRASWSGGEPCDEAPRVLLHFPPLAPLLGAFTHSSFCPGWLEGAWSSMAFRSQAALRGRSHVFHPCLA